VAGLPCLIKERKPQHFVCSSRWQIFSISKLVTHKTDDNFKIVLSQVTSRSVEMGQVTSATMGEQGNNEDAAIANNQEKMGGGTCSASNNTVGLALSGAGIFVASAGGAAVMRAFQKQRIQVQVEVD